MATAAAAGAEAGSVTAAAATKYTAESAMAVAVAVLAGGAVLLGRGGSVEVVVSPSAPPCLLCLGFSQSSPTLCKKETRLPLIFSRTETTDSPIYIYRCILI